MTNDAPITRDQIARGGNMLLAEAPWDVLDGLSEQARRQHWDRGAILCEAGRQMGAAYFIESGVASVIKPDDAERATEIALVGPEGFVGAAIVMADARWPYRTIVQVEHLTAIRIPAAPLQVAFDRSPRFRALLLRRPPGVAANRGRVDQRTVAAADRAPGTVAGAIPRSAG